MFRRFGVVLGIFIAVLLMPVQAWSAQAVAGYSVDQRLRPVVFRSPTQELNPNDVFKAVNETRSQAGVAPLRANKRLADIASQRAADMEVRQYYAHKSPDGRYYYDYFQTYGIDPDYSCENLDLVFTPDSQNVIGEWISSPKGHRECLLNEKLVEAGYATAKLTRVNLDGEITTAYVVVAVHTTLL